MNNLFQTGKFLLHSGEKSTFKIDCDALTDDDIATLAFRILRLVPPFSEVIGVPRGGLRLASALEDWSHRYHKESGLLVVDDVWTTGESMCDMASKCYQENGNIFGAVIFARTQPEEWVTPLFTMTEEGP